MRDSPIALALMLFSSDSPRQRVVAEPLNASRNLHESAACRRHFQTEILTTVERDALGFWCGWRRDPVLLLLRQSARFVFSIRQGDIACTKCLFLCSFAKLQNLSRFSRTCADHAAAANRLR